MIRLGTPNQPFEVELPNGVSVSVLHDQAADMAAQVAAIARARELREAGQEFDEVDFEATWWLAFAQRSIKAWDGVRYGDDQPAEPTRENIAALMAQPRMLLAFRNVIQARQLEVSAEKNASPDSASGTSAEAGTIATAAG